MNFSQFRRDKLLKKNEGMQKEIRPKFLLNTRRENDIDDSTFNIWKSELQKELPTFWEQVSKR